jgi:hypothetical protein
MNAPFNAMRLDGGYLKAGAARHIHSDPGIESVRGT